ncbi:MAG: hypothetical protein HZB51_32095 [Chloroflexi bacterium]|nr:hypothetical protein [Chloroflexota bacterium]
MIVRRILFSLVCLLLVACSSPVLAQSGSNTLSTSLTPTVFPLRDTRPPASSIQPTHSIDMLELGIGITLPPDWSIIKQPGVVLAGPGLTTDNAMEQTWLHLSNNEDVPQTIPELTQVMTEGMRTVGHINELATTRIVVGGSEGIAIWWTQPAPRDPNQPEHWVSIYVPAHGLVHEIVFHPILVTPDGKQLKLAGQAILDSIRFFPTTKASSASQATTAETPLGLSIEEHALKGKPELEPLTFEPVNGTQQEILRKHAAQRSERTTDALSDSQRSLVLGGDTYAANVAQTNPSRDVMVEVSRNGKSIYIISAGDVGPVPALWGLWGNNNHWVLEVAHTTEKKSANNVKAYDLTGEIIQDGVSFNRQYGCQETFGFQLMQGKPFYFFNMRGRWGVAYAGQTLDLGYSNISHYGCCSASALNPISAENIVAFFAQREATWYYVEIGVLR